MLRITKRPAARAGDLRAEASVPAVSAAFLRRPTGHNIFWPDLLRRAISVSRQTARVRARFAFRGNQNSITVTVTNRNDNDNKIRQCWCWFVVRSGAGWGVINLSLSTGG